MNDTLILVIALAAWVALQRWILPKFGIHTCLSPNSSCMSRNKTSEDETISKIETEKIEVEAIKD